MNTTRAVKTVTSSPDQVRAVLLDAPALPEWNPAFLSVRGPYPATTQHRYTLTVRPGLRGTWQYTSIQDERVEAGWHVPGFTETASWALL